MVTSVTSSITMPTRHLALALLLLLSATTSHGSTVPRPSQRVLRSVPRPIPALRLRGGLHGAPLPPADRMSKKVLARLSAHAHSARAAPTDHTFVTLLPQSGPFEPLARALGMQDMYLTVPGCGRIPERKLPYIHATVLTGLSFIVGGPQLIVAAAAAHVIDGFAKS